MQTIYTHIKPDGKLDINPSLMNEIIGKRIKLIYNEEKNESKTSADRLLKLLDSGPKVKGGPIKITKEWLYDRGDDDPRYRQ